MRLTVSLAVLALLIAGLSPASARDASADLREHAHKQLAAGGIETLAGVPTARLSGVACDDGFAGPFDCDGVDLLSFVPLSEFRGTSTPLGVGTSDIWGWTDPDSGDEYVILGKTNGAAFFRVTDPLNPVFLGSLVNPSVQLLWHDIKVYDNRAYLVSESQGHAMKVFDLTRLRGVTTPQTWVEDVRYPLNFAAHNIAINEESGTAFIVGGNVGLVPPDGCNSLHIVDIRNLVPVPAGCTVGHGYIHDTQCVIYRGPDADHTGREICLNSAERLLTIVDVTDRALPVTLSTLRYPITGYTHQGWLTEDQRHFLLGDELDESNADINTRTIILDVSDLDAPRMVGHHYHETASIDHNMYVKDGLVYQSNYTAGLRVLDTSRVADAVLDEVAWFDTYPLNDGVTFDGTWSNYPYFSSGTIAVSGIDEGLFLLRLADG